MHSANNDSSYRDWLIIKIIVVKNMIGKNGLPMAALIVAWSENGRWPTVILYSVQVGGDQVPIERSYLER